MEDSQIEFLEQRMDRIAKMAVLFQSIAAAIEIQDKHSL
jgi:hypothetical protein